MDDKEFLYESGEEMEDSSKDNDNGEEAFQDNREKSGRNPTTLENKILALVQQNGSENQQLHSGQSAETSVPTSASSSQIPNIDQLEETASIEDVFYSSLKLRIRSKCSQVVDAIISNRQHLQAFKYNPEESGRTTTILEQQVLPFIIQYASENQQLLSGISAETSSRPCVLTSVTSSQALNIDTPDDTFSSKHLFHSSRYFQTRTNYSRWADALLLPGQDPTYSSEQFLEHSDVDSAKTSQNDISPLEKSRDSKFASPPQSLSVRVTRSSVKARSRPETFTPPTKQIVDKRIGSTSAKKRKLETPESDYGKSRAKKASFRSNLLPSITARNRSKSPPNVKAQTVPAAQDSESSESLIKQITPNKRKREMVESGSSDSENETLPKSNLSSPRSDAVLSCIDHKSPNHKSPNKLQTEENKLAMQNLGKKFIKGVSSISKDNLTGSGSPEKQSNPENFYQGGGVILLTEKQKTISHSNKSTDAASGSPHKDLNKQKERSLAANTWCEDLPKKPGSPLKLRCISADKASSSTLDGTSNVQDLLSEDCESFTELKTQECSFLSEETQMVSDSNIETASNPRNFPTEDGDPNTKVKTRFSLASFEETESASKTAHSATKTQENDQSLSDTLPRTSEQNTKSRTDLKKLSARSLEMLLDDALTSINSFESQDIQALIQENRNLLLQRQHLRPISSGTSTSREGLEMDTSSKKISKYVSNVQRLLLKVLEEMMEFKEAKTIFRGFRELFRSVSESPCLENELRSTWDLMLYLEQRQIALDVKYLFKPRELTLENEAEEVYELIIHKVVTTLTSTVSVRSSMIFKTIMANYRMIKDMYENCREFWKNNKVEDIQDEESRKRVRILKDKTQEFLLRAKNAYREFLMHINEHANQEDIEKYEEDLLEEDKSYLRGQII